MPMRWPSGRCGTIFPAAPAASASARTPIASSPWRSIVEAVKRQAAVREGDWRALLRSLVDLVSAQSEPFLSLTDQNEGQPVIFWAVHPIVKAEINDDATYT